MNDPSTTVTVDLRIPGAWRHPQELIDRLPRDCRLTPESLILPDGTRIEVGFLDADKQFAGIFRSSCRQPPANEELDIVDNYTVNVTLSGPGGSLDSAGTMMAAAAAIIRAGGAGVFNDNSGLAHGGRHWLEMADDGGPDAVSFAFVAIVRGKTTAWTMGMHVLGLRDIVMQRTDIEKHGFDIVEVIRYMAHGEKPMGDGHILADLDGPKFQAVAEENPVEFANSAMHNPFGRLKLVSVRDIAETN